MAKRNATQRATYCHVEGRAGKTRQRGPVPALTFRYFPRPYPLPVPDINHCTRRRDKTGQKTYPPIRILCLARKRIPDGRQTPRHALAQSARIPTQAMRRRACSAARRAIVGGIRTAPTTRRLFLAERRERHCHPRLIRRGGFHTFHGLFGDHDQFGVRFDEVRQRAAQEIEFHLEVGRDPHLGRPVEFLQRRFLVEVDPVPFPPRFKRPRLGQEDVDRAVFLEHRVVGDEIDESLEALAPLFEERLVRADPFWREGREQSEGLRAHRGRGQPGLAVRPEGDSRSGALSNPATIRNHYTAYAHSRPSVSI